MQLNKLEGGIALCFGLPDLGCVGSLGKLSDPLEVQSALWWG